MRRVAVAAAGAVLAMFTAPGSASADVVFDPADADELAATLDEAYQEQRVCYGWQVDVDNVGIPESSVGSNFGAGESVQDHSSECDSWVVFAANITWTSESSESEDSATYSLISQPSGPSTADLDSLELISDEGLAGENPDVDVYKAVAALPLLAADAGLADPIEASPAPESEAAGAQPTNSPSSDFWRQTGGAIMWSAIMLVAAGAIVWWALATRKTSRRSVRRRAAMAPTESVPEYVPPQWSTPPPDPDISPAERRPPQPPPESPSTKPLAGDKPSTTQPPEGGASTSTPPGEPESRGESARGGDTETPDPEPGTETDRQSRPEG